MKHLACIMDGNRRWAKQQGFPSLYGHQQGIETVKTVIQFCLDKGISYLSLYTFSLENFKRSEEEKSYLFNLLKVPFSSVVEQCVQAGVRIQFIGDRSLFPAHIVPVCEDIEARTAHGSELIVHFLFCYGGQQEIISGVKRMMQQIKSGLLSEDAVDEEMLKKNMWMPNVPEPELIIRTGGHKRLSNFLLFQAAYSELCFLDCMWPALTQEDLERTVSSFLSCQRNFGV